MSVDKPYKQRGKSWYYDFKLPEQPREVGVIPGAKTEEAARIAANDWLKRCSLVAQGVASKEIKKPHATIEDLVERFFAEEVEGRYKSWETARGFGDRWIETHGSIDAADFTRENVFQHIAKRRKGYAVDGEKIREAGDGTIANAIDHLKRVLRKARRDWGYAVADVDFSELGLAARVNRDVAPWTPQQVLTFAKHVRQYEPDFSPIVAFEVEHVQRRGNILDLRWADLYEGGEFGVVRKLVKSKHDKPKWVTWTLTAKSAAIIDAQRGLHPTHVFTTVCKATRPNVGRKKGLRYPVSENTFTRFWDRTRADYGLPEGFRFHDLRHVLSEIVLDVTGDITQAQETLGHENVATTQRYLRGGKSKRRENATKALGDALAAAEAGNVVQLRRKAS